MMGFTFRCSDDSEEITNLDGTYYRVNVGGSLDYSNYIIFSGNSYTIKFYSNTASGTYQISGSTLTLSPPPWTNGSPWKIGATSSFLTDTSDTQWFKSGSQNKSSNYNAQTTEGSLSDETVIPGYNEEGDQGSGIADETINETVE
ncbi:MAG: hypothetical protein FWH53_02380 [Leptospirales bacterium]|nr:hypothetical protein [Leptospirales bacterium]